MVMTMINLMLLKLTENDKRIIFILLAIFIFILVIIAFIGYLITRTMRWQGKKINYYVTDVVVYKVINNEKDFRNYAKKKNLLVFYHQARIPAIILIVAVTFYIVASSFVGYVDPFNRVNGFGTLLFIWDFSTIIITPETGTGILINWPKTINTPHFVLEAWVSYIFVPLMIVGLVWYLLTVQAYIARYLQIKKLGQKIFADQLETYNPSMANQVPPKQNNPPSN